MNNYLYLFKHTLWNRIRYSLKKPMTYVYFVFMIGYAWLMLMGLGAYVNILSLNSKEGLMMILTAFMLFSMPSSIWTLTKKKGLIYQLSDTHFLFQMPINPKSLLIYGYRTGVFMELVLNIVIVIGCITMFHIPFVIALSYFIYASVIEVVFETALMICIYGNEQLSEHTLTLIRMGIKIFLLLLVVLFVYLFICVDSSMNVFSLFVFHPLLQLIPIVGWALAPVHLLIEGFSVISMIGTICYSIMFILTVYYAYKMPCHGEFYEDALTFAHEYQEMKNRSKKGEVVFSNKKRKLRKATITYKGKGAQAIFYRQVLEYKKKRFFIFSTWTLIYFIVGVIASYFYINNSLDQQSIILYMLLIMIYMVFLMSGYATKWTQELESIYLYLIPDAPIKKVFYSTLVEHIRSFVDGILMTFPLFIVAVLSFVQMILMVLTYILLQSIKLYLTMFVYYILGKALGKFFQQLLHMILFAFIVSIGAIVAFVGFIILESLTYALMIFVGYALVISCLLMFLCSFQFYRMERND